MKILSDYEVLPGLGSCPVEFILWVVLELLIMDIVFTSKSTTAVIQPLPQQERFCWGVNSSFMDRPAT